MPIAFPQKRLRLGELRERGSKLRLADVLPVVPRTVPPPVAALADAIHEANRAGRPVLFFMGAHPVKLGLSGYLCALLASRRINGLATSGAGALHDWELNAHGETSEDVAKYLPAGKFGLWRHFGELNKLAKLAARRGRGLGEQYGVELRSHRLSVAAACRRAKVPYTVHVGIGQDVCHMLPGCDGAAWGAASYRDFLLFAERLRDLRGGGVFVLCGSATTGPEIFQKALSMARNISHGQPKRFTVGVMDADLPDVPWDAVGEMDPAYYNRPLKVAARCGGRLIAVRALHQESIPALWTALQ